MLNSGNPFDFLHKVERKVSIISSDLNFNLSFKACAAYKLTLYTGTLSYDHNRKSPILILSHLVVL